jgi:hypothetical protein
VTTNPPIQRSVRLFDDDAPRPGKARAVFAHEASQEHRLMIAPEATDADLGQALRQGMWRTGLRHMT